MIICQLWTPALNLSTLTSRKKRCQRTALAAGAGGTDSKTIASWLPKFGTHSQRLRNAIARLAKWLSNDKPAYRVLMAGSLIALDKNPGVRPIAIGEVLRRLIAKCVLSVAKGVDQLCG